MGAQGTERRRAIESALLDYHRAPGRHTLALRQPALLFGSIRDVLQLAAERSLDDDGPPPAPPVVAAARFFVRAALLRPDADHYTLLGLAPGADTPAIKDHYRALMRLTHPDFAQSLAGSDWPADAATRINQAYETLSSPERREAYDQQREAPHSQPAPMQPPRDFPKAASRATSAPPRSDPRRVLRHLAMGFGALGSLALAIMWVATAQNDPDVLVQRKSPRVERFPSLFGAAEPASSATSESGSTRGSGTGLTAAIARALPALLSGPTPAPAPAPAAAPSPAVAAAPAPERTTVAVAEPVAPPPTSSPVDAPPAVTPAPLAQPAPAPAPAAVVVATPAVTPAPPPAVAAVAPAPAPGVVAPPRPATPPAASPPAPVLVARAAPAPAVAAARPVAAGGPTMRDVQSHLMRLVGEIESGWGDNLIAGLDGGARSTPPAQALARELDALCDGVRPVRIAKVDFKGAPRDGRLVVTGQVTLAVRDSSAPTRQFALQAEFMQRDGNAVLTRLGPAGAL